MIKTDTITNTNIFCLNDLSIDCLNPTSSVFALARVGSQVRALSQEFRTTSNSKAQGN
jgi:hypothetical protein